jgi:hypothetical protein
MTFLRYNLVFSILIETHSLVKKKRRYNSICNPTYRIPFVLPMITITLLCLWSTSTLWYPRWILIVFLLCSRWSPSHSCVYDLHLPCGYLGLDIKPARLDSAWPGSARYPQRTQKLARLGLGKSSSQLVWLASQTPKHVTQDDLHRRRSRWSTSLLIDRKGSRGKKGDRGGNDPVRTHGGRETCLVQLHLVGVDDLAAEA